MEEKLNALCVRAVDYKDGKTLLTLCTIEKGKLTAAIKGVKSSKSKLKYAASLLCFGEYVLMSKGGYYTVIGCSLHDAFYEVREDIDKFYASLAVAELLEKTVIEGTDISQNVLLAVNALKEISYGNEPIYSFYKHLLQVAEVAGYKLGLDIGHGADKKQILSNISRAYSLLANAMEIRVNAIGQLLAVV